MENSNYYSVLKRLADEDDNTDAKRLLSLLERAMNSHDKKIEIYMDEIGKALFGTEHITPDRFQKIRENITAW